MLVQARDLIRAIDLGFARGHKFYRIGTEELLSNTSAVIDALTEDGEVTVKVPQQEENSATRIH